MGTTSVLSNASSVGEFSLRVAQRDVGLAENHDGHDHMVNRTARRSEEGNQALMEKGLTVRLPYENSSELVFISGETR
jgi:hypothetical protein